MKKIIAKEFLWLVTSVVIAIPLTFVFLSLIDFIPKDETFNEVEKVFIVEFFLLGLIVNFAGIYLVRFIAVAFKTLSK